MLKAHAMAKIKGWFVDNLVQLPEPREDEKSAGHPEHTLGSGQLLHEVGDGISACPSPPKSILCPFLTLRSQV